MKQMRMLHRYLGFFLVGVMSIYALSGIVMTFRNTDFLKSEKIIIRNIKPNIASKELGYELKIRDLKIKSEDNSTIVFENGRYDKTTGIAKYTTKELPKFLNKLNQIHKTKSGDPLFFLNVFFGIALLFFVISSFWMFPVKTKTFKTGLIYVVAGIALTVLLLII